MKIYSQAYAHAPSVLDPLQRAKLTFINADGAKLHRVIDRAAAQQEGTCINVIKAALGLKASTPLPIRALNDLYYEQVHGQGMVKSAPARDAWAAARLFADHSTTGAKALTNPDLQAGTGRKAALKKTVRFAPLPPPYKQPLNTGDSGGN